MMKAAIGPAILSALSLHELNVLANLVHDGSERTASREGVQRPKKLKRSPELRRKQRLESEKKRLKAKKSLIEQLRRDVQALTVTLMERKRQILREPENPPYLLSYLSLVDTTQQLYSLLQHHEDLILRYQSHTTSLELQASQGYRFRIASQQSTVRTPVVIAEQRSKSEWILMDPITLFESILQNEPFTSHEAEAFVSDSCREMIESCERSHWVDGFQEFGGGLHGGYRVVGMLLEFRLAKRLPRVNAHTLTKKTWMLLTRLDQYRRIQPQTTHLRVLQRISDTLWIIGIAVGRRHSLVLVGRAAIPGGFIVTFRSLPLARNAMSASEAVQQRFIEGETGGIHANTFSWYSFQEQSNAMGEMTDCNVTFGGTARNIHHDYLNQLQLEIVAGFARWQTAMGYPHVLFLPSLVTS